jgi:hypothetical protein
VAGVAAPGDTLVVLATAPAAPLDPAARAADDGHGFVERRVEGWLELSLLKGGATPGWRDAPSPANPSVGIRAGLGLIPVRGLVHGSRVD